MRRCGTARGRPRPNVAVALVVVGALLAGLGCVNAEPGVSLGEAFLSGRAMRFDDSDPDRDIAGEVGGTFGSFTGGCST